MRPSLQRLLFLAALMPPAAVPPLSAAVLPDTGVKLCYDDTAVAKAANLFDSPVRDLGKFPRQDCRYGADAIPPAQSSKTGAGDAGFDYTKIANSGAVLPANAALGPNAGDWACTRDNRTGLIWEVKTGSSASDYRYSGHLYTWYDADPTTNGGDLGSAGDPNSCNNTLPGMNCDTATFKFKVNTNQLCTFPDWRVPSVRELQTIVHYGVGGQFAIDPTYFPNTASSGYWSSVPVTSNPINAWYLNFQDGGIAVNQKAVHGYLRLVRGGKF